MGGDVSVPVARVAEFLDTSAAALRGILPEVELNGFGHMGDGNIHYSIRKPATTDDGVWDQCAGPLLDCLNEQVASYGGSFSAEHGIGSAKREL